MSENVRTTGLVPETPSYVARCRWCRGKDGEIVLDLGHQPASDHFPMTTEQAPDPRYPLQMWLCSSCGLAQLLADPTVPEEPLAAEPVALVRQAAAAVDLLTAAGWLRPKTRVVEFGSPHGGSWVPMLRERGITPSVSGNRADVVLDCFGMMHEGDQRIALCERVSLVGPAGTLLLQFHSVAAIVRLGQWNALRHGHYAYYSVAALVGMLDEVGFSAVSAWEFDLYGGTVLLAAQPTGGRTETRGASVTALLDSEARLSVTKPRAFAGLEDTATADAGALKSWLREQRRRRKRVAAYGAASRTVALLCKAEIGSDLLPGVADASPAKHGRRMPGTDIPVISPAMLVEMRPDAVLLTLPDLLDEVRSDLPEVEAYGGRWVTIADVGDAR